MGDEQQSDPQEFFKLPRRVKTKPPNIEQSVVRGIGWWLLRTCVKFPTVVWLMQWRLCTEYHM